MKAQTYTQRAPIGGWNTRDDVGNMPPEDAELLENWIPSTSNLLMRPPALTRHSSSAGVPVTSLYEYEAPNRPFLIAASGNAVEAFDSLGGTPLFQQGFNGNQWQGVNFSDRFIMVNGADNPISIALSAELPAISALSFTGPDLVSRLIDVHVFKGRLMFVEDGTADFWYADVDAIAGTLTRFPLSRVAKSGGKLLTIKSWTVDGGDGPDDYCAFILDTGEVIVYQGTDPGRSSAWGLVGRYQIPRPISRRAVREIGGQILIATEEDYVTIPTYFVKPIATKLCGALRDAAVNKELPGWDIIHYKAGGLIVANVPTSVSTSEQHVINIKTGAATKFTGLNASQFSHFQGKLFFGSLANHHVLELDESRLHSGYDIFGTTSNPSNYSSIVCRALTAPTNCGVSIPKQIVDYQKVLTSEGTVHMSSGLVYDFSGKIDFYQAVDIQGFGTQWGSPWSSPWGDENKSRLEWNSGAGDGEYVQLRSEVTASQQTPKWFKTRFRYVPTGPLE